MSLLMSLIICSPFVCVKWCTVQTILQVYMHTLGLIGFLLAFIVGTQCCFLKAAQRALINRNWGWWCCYYIIRQQGNWCSSSSRCTGIYPSATIHMHFHELRTLSLLSFLCQLFFLFFTVQYTEGNLWRRTYCWNTRGSQNRSPESSEERESA